MHYIVMRIKDGKQLYAGHSQESTARASEPGTCYKSGSDGVDAYMRCETYRLWLLAHWEPLPEEAPA